jgi:hypothetical protein
MQDERKECGTRLITSFDGENSASKFVQPEAGVVSSEGTVEPQGCRLEDTDHHSW